MVMSEAETERAVIAMLVASLEIPDNDEDRMPDELIPELIGPLKVYDRRVLNLSHDPVSWAELKEALADYQEDLADDFAEHLTNVVAYMLYLFNELAREAETADPEFDIRAFLQQHALDIADDSMTDPG